MAKVIELAGVGKQYQLGQLGGRTVVEDVQRWWARLRRQPNPFEKIGAGHGRSRHGTLWALRDIDLSVRRGEVLGIIGRNGAGKSTLLKILSRITAPTTGEVRLRGRLASLLEVGTGFHPDLTGRENVFLNGAILGLRKHEIAARFDDIVDFAEIGEYIDTPVKRYSSGMYVRLAFAVAAHLEPDILVVDEVLAVGDIEFQRKCLGRMKAVSGHGRTVLFVSHNMEAVAKLCDRVLLLKDGRIHMDSCDVRAAIQTYVSQCAADQGGEWRNSGSDFDNPWFAPMSVRIRDARGETVAAPVPSDAQLELEITGSVGEMSRDLTIGYYCYAESSTYPVYVSQQNDTDPARWPQFRRGVNTLVTPLPAHLLNEGRYTVRPYVIMRTVDRAKLRLVSPEDDGIAVSFEIRGVVNESPSWMRRRGVIAPVLPWVNETADRSYALR